MTVYPDTSFLVSWLYPRDVNHAKAARWFATRQSENWIVSPWAEFETINTLRGLVLQNPGPRAAAMEARRRYFKHLFRAGPLEREEVDWEEVFKDAHQISASSAMRIKARSADVLHVAILEQIHADVFVTFDKEQAVLATSRGFHTVHLR
jgi:predicted nucleic acid-binding protein